MRFYHILTLKHMIRFQNITLYTYQSLQKLRVENILQLGLQAQKNESLTLTRVFIKENIYMRSCQHDI